MHVKSVEAQPSSLWCGVVVRRRGMAAQKCHLRHLTLVQIYEYRPNTARFAERFLKDEAIQSMEGSACFPDLNSIEHVWDNSDDALLPLLLPSSSPACLIHWHNSGSKDQLYLIEPFPYPCRVEGVSDRLWTPPTQSVFPLNWGESNQIVLSPIWCSELRLTTGVT
ncbi:hypothetical protein TNCV_1963371 [Trichonephila clavipes]|nr:hypothetical protein TNCV_1963371 [Trichonephila clavipes]